jgi:small-conductance mechanosensitive channel
MATYASLGASIKALFDEPERVPLIAIAIALALLLSYLRSAERSTYRNTLLVLAAGLALEVLGAALLYVGVMRPGRFLLEAGFILGAVAIIRLVCLAIFRLLLPRCGFLLPKIHEDLAIAGAVVMFGFMQLRYAGVDLSGLLATSAIITAVLAFAMQDTLGNVMGGFLLQLDNSVRIGDWIQIDGMIGRVVEIHWRSTTIETPAWETVFIPNSVLMKRSFQVLGRRTGEAVQWRRVFLFVIDPGTPPHKVIETAEQAVRSAHIANVAPMPAPHCLLLNFEGGNVTYAFRYWCSDVSAFDPVDSDVRLHVFSALQRAGIRIAEPQQKLHVVAQDEHHADVVKGRETARRVALLKQIDLFSTLSAEERQAVAARLKFAPYARGDLITRQGAESHWLYIIASGEADVVLATERGAPTKVGELAAGQFFGEMALMTGAPRSASVYAKTDVTCYRLDSQSFQDLLHNRPEIAEDMSRIITERRKLMAEATAGRDVPGIASPEPSHLLLKKIKDFFGM